VFARLLLAVAAAGFGGCTAPLGDAGYGLWGRPARVAVAPAQDLTGTGHLDALVLTDLLASELSRVPGLTVVPVNQTLSAMAGQGWRSLSSPGQVRALGRLLGVDGVIVVGVTEYDPYEPPVVGLIAELYLVASQQVAINGEDLGRLPSPPASKPAPAEVGPARQVQMVVDASSRGELRMLRRFARARGAAGRNDWQQYLRSQRKFLRYCCWRVVRALLKAGPEGSAAIAGSAASAAEAWASNVTSPDREKDHGGS